MSLNLRQLLPNAYVLEYLGNARLEELQETYQKVAALENLNYLLVDGSQMMYEENILADPSLSKIIKQVISSDSLSYIIFNIPQDHPLEEMTTQRYKSMGYLHKIKFVTSCTDGIALIKTLSAEDTS